MFVNMTVNSDALTILVRSYMRIISNFREMTVILVKKTLLSSTDFCWGCRKRWTGLPIANASQNSDHIKCNGEQNNFSSKGSDHNEQSYHINTSCQHDTLKYLFENHLRGNKLLKMWFELHSMPSQWFYHVQWSEYHVKYIENTSLCL